MDHSHALETQAVERYLLGELPAEQAEEFEVHFFDCPHCATAVESGALFIEGARAHFRRPAPAPQPSFWEAVKAFWRQPAFTLPVTAVLAALALYQGTLVIPALRRTLGDARPLPAFELIGASRGTDPLVRVPAGTPFIALAADVPPEAHFRSYLCVVSSSDKVVLRVVNPAPEPGHPVTILVPANSLRPGKQELAIYGQGSDGQSGGKISTYPFDFETD